MELGYNCCSSRPSLTRNTTSRQRLGGKRCKSTVFFHNYQGTCTFNAVFWPKPHVWDTCSLPCLTGSRLVATAQVVDSTGCRGRKIPRRGRKFPSRGRKFPSRGRKFPRRPVHFRPIPCQPAKGLVVPRGDGRRHSKRPAWMLWEAYGRGAVWVRDFRRRRCRGCGRRACRPAPSA